MSIETIFPDEHEVARSKQTGFQAELERMQDAIDFSSRDWTLTVADTLDPTRKNIKRVQALQNEAAFCAHTSIFARPGTSLQLDGGGVAVFRPVDGSDFTVIILGDGMKVAGTIDSVTVNIYPDDLEDEAMTMKSEMVPSVALILRGVATDGIDPDIFEDGIFEIPLCYGVEDIALYDDPWAVRTRTVDLGACATNHTPLRDDAYHMLGWPEHVLASRPK